MIQVPSKNMLIEAYVDLLRECHGNETQILSLRDKTISASGEEFVVAIFILSKDGSKHTIYENSNNISELFDTFFNWFKPTDDEILMLYQAMIEVKIRIHDEHAELVMRRMMMQMNKNYPPA